jgi:hypothetical protein
VSEHKATFALSVIFLYALKYHCKSNARFQFIFYFTLHYGLRCQDCKTCKTPPFSVYDFAEEEDWLAHPLCEETLKKVHSRLLLAEEQVRGIVETDGGTDH